MTKPKRVGVKVASDTVISATVQGEGPAILLLHGVPGSAAVWRQVAEELSAAFQVITPDLLGFGASSRVVGSSLLAMNQASAIHRMLTEFDVKKPTVVGHDFGGPVALTMERMAPGTMGRLVLSATNTFPDTPIPFPLSSILWPMVGSIARKAIFSRASLALMLKQGVGNGHVRLDPARYLGDKDQSGAIASIFTHSLMNLSDIYSPIEKTFRGLDIPVSVIWGTKDPFFPVAQGQRTAAAVGVELQLYEGAGHFIPEERPAAFARDIAAFVRPGRDDGFASLPRRQLQ